MSWSPDLYIGELRPWPDSVHVVRGKTDEARRYTPERKDVQEALECRIDELCAEAERHKAEYARLCDGYGSMSREHTQTIVELSDAYEKIDQLETENAKLREYITKLEQANIALDSDNTELRDDMRDMQMFVSDNAKLRELVRVMYYCNLPWKDCDECAMNGADMHVEIDEMEFCDGINDHLRELGVVE